MTTMDPAKNLDARRDRRAQIAGVGVRYTSTTGELVDDEALDISKGGMFVKTGTPLPVGDRVELEIRVLGEDAVLSVVARVMWSRGSDDTDGHPAGMALAFVEIEDAALALIEQLVGNRERTVEGLGASGAPFTATGAHRAREHTLLGVAPAPALPTTDSTSDEIAVPSTAPVSRIVSHGRGAGSAVAPAEPRERTFQGLGYGDASATRAHEILGRERSIPLDLVRKKAPPPEEPAPDADEAAAVEPRAEEIAPATAAVPPPAARPAAETRRGGAVAIVAAVALIAGAAFVWRGEITAALQSVGVLAPPAADAPAAAPSEAQPPLAAAASTAPASTAHASTAHAKSSPAVSTGASAKKAASAPASSAKGASTKAKRKAAAAPEGDNPY